MLTVRADVAKLMPHVMLFSFVSLRKVISLAMAKGVLLEE